MRYCRYLVLSSATARWRIGLGCRTSFLIKAFGRSRIFATISKRIAARCLIRTGAMPANRLRKKGLRPRLLTKSDWSRYNDRWNVTRESSEGASSCPVASGPDCVQWPRSSKIVSNQYCLCCSSEQRTFIPSTATHSRRKRDRADHSAGCEGWEGRTARNAEPVDPAIRTTQKGQSIVECELLTGT